MQIEVQFVDIAEQMISILKQTMDKWWVEDGYIMFEEDEDLEAFNKANAELQLLAERQMALTDKMRLDQAKRVERMRQQIE